MMNMNAIVATVHTPTVFKESLAASAARTNVGRYVQHLQCGLKARHWQGVFDQPYPSENYEVHYAEETGEH